MAVVLGLDIGTTSIGVVAFDADEREPIFSSEAANSATVIGTASGLHEQNAIALFDTVRQLLDSALNAVQQAQGDVRSIGGIAVTGQMHGILLVDLNNRPRSNLFTWRDQRSTKAPLVREVYANDAMARRCGCRLQPGYGFATLHQLMIDDRNIAAELRTGVVRICGIADFVSAKLCGSLVTDTSMAASWGGLDIQTHRWDEEILDLLQIPRGSLPSVLPPSQPYGTIRPEFASTHGLDSGTPVCAGIGDHQASVLACRPIQIGTCIVNVGTGSQISIVQSGPEPVGQLETRPLLPGYFILTGAGLCGGWSYAHLARFFQSVTETFASAHIPLSDIYETMNETGSGEAQDASGLTVDPRFLGSRSDHCATGSIRGIDAGNLRPSSLIRATANGIVDELFSFFSQAKVHAGRLFVTGNAARKSPLLRQAVRDRWGKDPVVIQHEQEAALGAAHLAAINLDLMDRSWLLGG